MIGEKDWENCDIYTGKEIKIEIIGVILKTKYGILSNDEIEDRCAYK